MIRAGRLLLLGVALASWLGVPEAVAGALVEFPNVSEQAPRLLGYLARPDAGLSALASRQFDRVGPYPAVVVLHGCSGVSGHSIGIADRLGSWGYVALAVDSLSPRGISSACGGGLLGQAFDAYAARRYLSTLEDVDPARIAVLGQSMGAGAALYAVDRDLAAQYFTDRFRAAILYYPGCGIPSANLTAPALILIGEVDQASPVEQCRGMVAHAQPEGAPIALTIYPGVHHNFDVALLTPGVRYRGSWLEYNGPAAKDAEEKIRTFLDAHLAETSRGEPTSK
jgi:dienelactone hydrolase